MCVPKLTPHSRQAGHTVGVSGYQPVPGIPNNLSVILQQVGNGILSTFYKKEKDTPAKTAIK
jgi:hypothetical protein